MKSVRWLKLSLLLVTGFLTLLVFFKFRGGNEPELYLDPEVQASELVFLGFDRENNQKVEIRCRQSRRGEHEKTLMTDVWARIISSGRRKKDILISGKNGEVTADFRGIMVAGDARVRSDKLELLSPVFNLHHGDYLITLHEVVFSVQEGLSGRAGRGMEFFMERDGFKFFQVAGTWNDGTEFCNFTTDIFWIFENPQKLMFYGENTFTSADAELSGGFMVASMADDFRRLSSIVVEGDASFKGLFVKPDGNTEQRRITAGALQSFYDDANRLKRILIRDQGEVELICGPDQVNAVSDHMEISFGEKGVESVKVFSTGLIDGKGENEFKLAGERITAEYGEDGFLTDVLIQGTAFFQNPEIKVGGDTIRRVFHSGLITVEGQPAELFEGENLFSAPRFSGDSARGEMLGSGPVKSVLVFKDQEGLFSGAEFFVSAGSVRVLESGALLNYSGSVSMVQDKTSIKAEEVRINRNDKSLFASGKVEMELSGSQSGLILSGETVVYNAVENTLKVDKNASIKSAGNDLKADEIVVLVDSDLTPLTIDARQVKEFKNNEVKGRSREMHWDCRRGKIHFLGQAVIEQSGGGRSEGADLELDLDSGTIRVHGQSRRTRTQIKE